MTPSNFIPLALGNLPKAQSSGFVPTIVPPQGTNPHGQSSAQATVAHGAHSPQTSEPAIEMKKDGERVVEITIRCSCGEVIKLDCQ